MSRTAFVFPGQGAQYVGMAKEFYECFPQCREVFEEASEAAGFSMEEICFEENEKIPLFLKILNAKMDGFIDDNEYHRLMILTDRTLYSDLLYLKDNITEDPVKLNSDSDYGLASSGLLVAAGNEWVEGMDDADNGVRFNYTLAAKKMAYIFFGVECAMKPSNKGITILVAASNEEVEEQLNELFK